MPGKIGHDFSHARVDTARMLLNTRWVVTTAHRSPNYATWLLIAAAIAVVCCCVLAASIPTQAWAEWFHHPDRQPRPDATDQGAMLWRVMLCILAVCVAGLPLLLIRLNGEREGTRELTSPCRKRLWLFFACVVSAVGWRAPRLSESLWYDEIASWMTYSMNAASGWAIISSFRDPINQVAHTLLNHFSVKMFISSLGVEIAFRLPAFLLSLLSVGAVFGLARSALGGRIGTVAALLTAVLPVSVLEGVEARSYSMVICFSALMSWMWIEAVKRREAWRWCIYAICCAIGIWAHFVAAFAPIGHAAWLVWRASRRKDRRLFFSGGLALALGAVLTITLYSPMIPDMLHAKGMFASDRGNEAKVLGSEGFHALLQFGGSWYWWAAIPGLVLAASGLLRGIRSRSELQGMSSGDVIAITLLGLPLMVLTVIISGSWIYARFALFALPGSILLIALGVESLWRRDRRIAVAALGLVVVGSILDLTLRPPKQPLRDAAQYAREHWQDSDRMVIVGLAHPVMKIYLHDLQPTYSYFGGDLKAALDAVSPSWVVIEYPLHASADRFRLLHDRGYRVVPRRFNGWADWKHGDVIVMRRSEGAPPASAPR